MSFFTWILFRILFRALPRRRRRHRRLRRRQHHQEPGPKTIVCKHCHTRISDDGELAPKPNVIRAYSFDMNKGQYAVLVKKVENCYRGFYWSIQTDSVVNLHCSNCGLHIGIRHLDFQVPIDFIRPRWCSLYLDEFKVITGDGMLDATTLL